MKKIIFLILITFLIVVFLKANEESWNKKTHAQSNEPYASLKAAVNALPSNSGALILLPNGEIISKNPTEQFPTFSVIKLWIAAAVFYDARNNGTQVNDDTLVLITSMLTNSDNTATNTLIDGLGGCSNGRCDIRVMQVADDDSYPRTYIRRKMLETATRPENDNLTSPQDAVNFMQNLINKQIVDEETSNRIISILQTRTTSGSDPFKPNSLLPSSADFIGKSGILGQGRNDVGSFIDTTGQRVYFAIFVPNGGTGTDQAISNIEQLIYNPASTPTALPPTTAGTSTPGTQTSVTARSCVKVGTPTEPKPAICNILTTAPAGGGTGSTPIAGQPAPAVEGSQLSATIKEQFGIEMRGGWDQQHLQWIYEKFYDLKQQTRFTELVRGEPVTLIAGIPNQETGFVEMSQTGAYATDKDYFIGTLIHELGHSIYHNKSMAGNLTGEVNNLFDRIRCVSTYSRCQGDKTENYPEVIAFCLNNKAVGSMHPEKWAQYREIAVRIMGFCYN